MAINVVQLGAVPYALGLKLQQELEVARKANRIADTLLLLEHTPVITLGRNAKAHHVLASPEQLAARGVEVFESNRGGDVTFHGPGQVVGYPVFNILELQPKLGAVDFVRRLEEVLIRTCADFGIAAQRIAGATGVWTCSTPPRKLAAIGVHISRGVTTHGFALNVNTDLDYFPVTSLQREMGREVGLDDVNAKLARHFGGVFNSQILWLETVDAVLGQAVGIPLREPAGISTREEIISA